MSEFVHLHNHTDYSLLDAAQSIDMMCDRLGDINMDSIAVTEHGNLFSLVPFYKNAKKNGIKPIMGCEVYVATGSHKDRHIDKNSKKWNYHHLLLLVQNDTGLKNLIQLVSIGFLNGFYYKPRVDKELIRQHSDGLICTSGCLAGEVNYYASIDDYDNAKRAALEYKEIFNDRFFLELQNHGIDKEIKSHKILSKLSQDLDIPLVATNDNHYAFEEHSESHDILFCCGMGKELSDPNRLRYEPRQFYIKTQDEMHALFKDYPGAIENTRKIAEMCNADISMGSYHLPTFPIPELNGDGDPDKYLRNICINGLKNRYNEITPTIQKRLDYELDVIKKMGFAGYFLITQDFVNYAKTNRIPVGPGRGSAVGSIVSYASGITDLDPIKYNLLFERFLNPDRVSMPDIDIDFCVEGREKVIDYIKSKYGKTSVAQIITFGKMKAKSSIRDVGRVMGMPYGQVDNIAKMIPNDPKITIDRAMALNKDLKKTYDESDTVRSLIDHSKILEGMNRHASTHAAGIVITPGPLTDYVPLYKNPSTDDITTQADMKSVEDLGLLKMDFLGLRNLTVIDKTLKIIKRRHKKEIDILSIQLDDRQVFNLFSSGRTVGVFQFESSGMQEHLKNLQPTEFEDLIVMNSLYRPGPMASIPEYIKRKHGQAEIRYLHPSLEPILKDSCGIVVYQEQVMQIANTVGGFTLGQSDLMRRAMGKKKKRLMAGFKTDFVNGAKSNAINEKIATEIFELLAKFAEYGFNKSHSAAYALIAYQTAWLKTYYPAEYYAANLSSDINDTDKVVKLIDDAKSIDVEVLAPDVKMSYPDFRVIDDLTISYGLAAIKNVGYKAAQDIAKSRDEHGYSTIFDLCKINSTAVTKKTLESLILSGACDQLGGHRAQQFESIERVVHFGQLYNKTINNDQGSLFSGSGIKMEIPVPALSDAEEWSNDECLSKEKNLIGFYLSGNPLEAYETDLKDFEITSSSAKNKELRLGGLISTTKLLFDKRNNQWAIITLERMSSKAEIFIFSDLFDRIKDLIYDNSMIFVTGKLSNRQSEYDDVLKVIADDVIDIKKVRNKLSRHINIKIGYDQNNKEILSKIHSLATSNKGNCRFVLNIESSTGYVQRIASSELNVSSSLEFISELRELLGDENVWVAS
jgi:DNA polymerase-3 subunit alpha